MPELPEVESVRRQLAPALAGRTVVALWHDVQPRFLDLDRLAGRTVVAVGRRGKFLVCPLDAGLFGRLAVVDAGAYGRIPTLAQLGPEPLSDEFDPDRFARQLAATRAPVKPWL